MEKNNPFNNQNGIQNINQNEFIDINTINDGFEYGNITPGNDKKLNNNLLNIKEINDRKSLPINSNNNLNKNKNEDPRGTIQMNNKNEIYKQMLDKLNEQTIFPSNDDESCDNLLDGTNNNFIFSIIKDLQGDKDKQDISILEDDYIKPKILNNISNDNFKKIIEIYNKSLMDMKKVIDNYRIIAKNFAFISSLENLLKKNYYSNMTLNMKIVLENLNIYEQIIYKWRGTKGDKNCFYRCVMFYYIESIILEKNIQYFMNFFNDVFVFSKEEYFIKIFEHYQIKMENFLLILVLIYWALMLKDTNDAIITAYSILIKAFNNSVDFEIGIILYLKYAIYKYLKKNEGKLYTKDFSVNINNLLPERYQRDNCYLYKEFYEKDLLSLNGEAERIIIYITPFVLGKTMKIYSFDFINSDNNTLKEIPFDAYANLIDLENPDKNAICLLFVNLHYDIVYPKEYFNKFQQYLIKFSEVILPPNNNNMNNNLFRAMTQRNNINYPQLQKAISAEIKNKILPSQISNLTGFEEEKKLIEKYNCPSCKTETKINFFCDKCNSSILKMSLETTYCNFIKYNISNLITMKEILNFKKFIQKFPIIVNYYNKQKKNFEEGYNLLINKFNIDTQIKIIKNTLCLGCFHLLKINENCFFFQLPCKCVFCSIDCLKKFITAIPFNKMNSYICACGEEYDIIKLKYFVSFLSSHNLHKTKDDFIRYLYNKMKNKCAKCNSIINFGNNQINIIEVSDVEAERIFNISKFNHLICDKCWKNVSGENSKFICEICYSIHFIHKKASYKTGNIRENCSIF